MLYPEVICFQARDSSQSQRKGVEARRSSGRRVVRRPGAALGEDCRAELVESASGCAPLRGRCLFIADLVGRKQFLCILAYGMSGDFCHSSQPGESDGLYPCLCYVAWKLSQQLRGPFCSSSGISPTSPRRNLSNEIQDTRQSYFEEI